MGCWYLIRGIFWSIFRKKYLVCFVFVKMFTTGYKPRSWHSGHCSTHWMYGRNKNNVCSDDQKYRKKKSLSRDKPWSLFISSGNICIRIRALHFYVGFCRRVKSLRRSARRYGNAKIFLRTRGTNAKRISES